MEKLNMTGEKMQTAPLLQFTQKVVGEIHSILRNKYHVPVNPDVPVRYYLTAMRDERLEELQEALGRMTRGKYRECEICGGQIPDEVHIFAVTAKACHSCRPSAYPMVYQPGSAAQPAPNGPTRMRAA